MKKTLIALVYAISTSIASANHNYTRYFDDLYSQTTAWGGLESIFNMYESQIGAGLFWGILLATPFVAMWIKQQSVVMPTVVALIVGGVLIAKVPPEFDLPVKILLAIGVSGVLYHMFTKK